MEEVLLDEIDRDIHPTNINSEGYARSGSDKVHVVVMKRVLGREIKPGFVIDHINRNKLDNRRNNLREVTSRVNSLNKSKSREFFGSTFLKHRNKWQAQIKINGKQTYLGVFNLESEACECYLKKVKELDLQS